MDSWSLKGAVQLHACRTGRVRYQFPPTTNPHAAIIFMPVHGSRILRRPSAWFPVLLVMDDLRNSSLVCSRPSLYMCFPIIKQNKVPQILVPDRRSACAYQRCRRTSIYIEDATAAANIPPRKSFEMWPISLVPASTPGIGTSL